MPWSSSSGISCGSCSSVLASETATRAPCFSRKRALATPDLPSPTTSTRLPLISIIDSSATIVPRFSAWLAQLQRGESKECKHQGGDPETHNHLGLTPAQQFEMVVNRRHLENALLAKLVGAHLEDLRQRLNHENAPDKWQQQLLLDDDSHGADRSPEGQRSH